MKELIAYFIRRIQRDEIAIEAGSLAYTSILALVPAMTIVLSIFAMVPSFTPIKEEMMNFASANFLPVFTDAISNSITTFVSHAASMTLTGSLMLIVVSLMLIRSVDHSINRIWRGASRSIPMTFAIYWTMLTVGPLAMGIIVWITTRIVALKFFTDTQAGEAVQILFYVMPFFIEMSMIFVIYAVMPVCRVAVRDALTGAFVVALSFEILKRLFSAFILNFSDYEAIYGALAALPVLMMWIYFNWWLVLIGAEFTAVLGLARSGREADVPRLIYSLVKLTGKVNPPEGILSASTVRAQAHRTSTVNISVSNFTRPR